MTTFSLVWMPVYQRSFKTFSSNSECKVSELGLTDKLPDNVIIVDLSVVLSVTYAWSLICCLHRTARGDNVGTALSFVTANDYKILKQAEEELTKEFTGAQNIIIFLT